MPLNPLVELRSWLQHHAPGLWEGLIFLGGHAPELMVGAAVWILGLLIIMMRRSGGPTAAIPAEQRPTLPEGPAESPPAS